jgi:hypothetical protein
MRRDEWARLAAPFPATDLDWCVAQLDREGDTARLEPVVREVAVVERLDDVLGVDGWSTRLLPMGPDAVVCELELLGVRKSAAARSFGGLLDMTRVCGWALGRAAGLAGMRPPVVRDAWVDFDMEIGEPVVLPEGAPAAGAAGVQEPAAVPTYGADLEDEPAAGGSGLDAAGQSTVEAPDETGGRPPASSDARSEGQQVIERLVDRLRAVGLGREAAALVVEHGGYGRSPEDARELYRKLRELLLEKGTAS